ncbi:MAG: toprim domain-containing protein, partial [Chloroflexota bacterium]|nr:toprim domain-containing protein [Chloroflexota bacterium]
VDPDRTPRFQALPGPKPVLGLGRVRPTPSWVVVAEGVFDWLALAAWGIPAIAALGTQGVERVAPALRGCPRVFLAFDNDEPGLEATERLAGLLGRRSAVVVLPDGAGDVAELACLPHGRAAFLRLLARAARSAR